MGECLDAHSHLNQKKVKITVLATITLHNWQQKDSSHGNVYIPSQVVDNEDITAGEITERVWRKDLPTKSWYSMSVTKVNNPTQELKAIWEEFNKYFFNEGSVPWQWRCVRIDV